MQIFSTSHTRSFSFSRESVTQKGFTLVELLVSIGIIGMVTSIVLVKYSSFDSTVLLKDTAYEIALALREAQVKSISAVRGNGCFDCPYGVTFDVTSATKQKMYRAFQYTNPDITMVPRFDTTTAFTKTVATTTIGRSMQVSNICITTSSGENCTLERLDISFRRPEFSALFYAVNGGTNYSSAITSSKIIVRSTNNAKGFIVGVTKFGQITVTKEL